MFDLPAAIMAVFEQGRHSFHRVFFLLNTFLRLSSNPRSMFVLSSLLSFRVQLGSRRARPELQPHLSETAGTVIHHAIKLLPGSIDQSFIRASPLGFTEL